MAILFVIPGQLREFSNQRSEVRVDGNAGTIGEALGLLWHECPGARPHHGGFCSDVWRIHDFGGHF